ncbi:MAG TPA: malto-oligosyltrehalose trehalohydrolase [Rubrivivax sp.]|nr:malto-oligosyltrehalose trehalohydrolase [Rubrivivax sp.]
MRHAHAMPFGATLLPGGGARFALWAPAARSVELVLAPAAGEPVQLAAAAQGEGWYALECPDVAAGQRYQWRIDGDLLVPDPASRSNPDGPHGASQLVDPQAFEWADDGWRGRPWRETVLYELHVGCFTSEGTFAAAAAELPRLAALGITAVQLMPLADFPGNFGWGYDGVLPFAPFHGYGTPDDLKRFVQAAHGLGLMVFGDVVYNHFGPDGNYLHAYAPQFFSNSHRTAWGPALNFDGEAAATVREFIVHNALYWIEEFRFDGLRLDAVHAMLDDSRPHILQELSTRVRAACSDRHVHLVLENDSNDETRLAAPGTPGCYDGQWNGDLHHTLHVLLTGERDGYYAEYDAPLQQLARCLTHGFARQGGPHNAEGAQPRRAAQGQAPLLAVVNLLHNHDQIGNRAFGERLQQLAEPAAMRLATALLLLSPTTPMLFMGEELGSTAPFLYFADWEGDLRAAVQRGRMEEFAHFERYAQAAHEGRLPDPCSRETFERCKLEGSGTSDAAWPGFYAELLARRRSALQPWLDSLAGQGHRSAVHGTLLKVWWDFGSRRLHMQANLGPLAVDVDAPPGGTEPWFELGDNHGPSSLAAWGGRWVWLQAQG